MNAAPTAGTPSRWPRATSTRACPLALLLLLVSCLVGMAPSGQRLEAQQRPSTSLCGTAPQIDPPSLELHGRDADEDVNVRSRLDVGTERPRVAYFPVPEQGAARPLPAVDPRCDPLQLQAALVWQDAYHPGESVVIDLVIGTRGATVAIDFSQVDDQFRPGDEEVIEMGDGHYRVEHRISRQSRRRSGTFALPIRVESPTDTRGVIAGERSARGRVEVRYLASPRRPRLDVVNGRMLLGPVPSRPRGEVSITGLKVLGPLKTTATMGAPSTGPSAVPSTVPATVSLPGPGRSAPGKRIPGVLRHRTRLFVTMTAAAGRLPRDLELEIWQPGIDAHWQLPVRPGKRTCARRQCRFSVMVELGTNEQPEGTFDLRLRVVADGGASGPAQVPDLPLQAPYVEPTHRVSGHVRFQYVHRFPSGATSEDRPDWPQYADVASTIMQKSVKRALVVLEDECGHYIQGATDASGYYSFAWNPTNCGIGRVTAWAVVKSGDRKAAVGVWKHGPVNSYYDLTTNTSDYLAHYYSASFWTSEADLEADPGGTVLDVTVPSNLAAARGFYILDNVVTAQDYYRDIAGVFGLPKLNVIYSPGLKPEDAPDDWDGGYAVYMSSKHPGMIVIPAEPEYGWNRFAHTHEVAHYFQKHYLRNMSYGRIGEPLANAHAMAIMGTEWFDKFGSFESIDAQPNYKEGEFRGATWNYCNGCDELDYSYGWTQRALWDLVDGTSNSEPEPITSWYPDGENSSQGFGQFDLYDGGGGDGKSTDADDHQLNDVLMNYVGGGLNGSESQWYVDRGLLDVDIVDVIDGMLCRQKISEEAVEKLFNDTMMFGYVFGGPGDC